MSEGCRQAAVSPCATGALPPPLMHAWLPHRRARLVSAERGGDSGSTSTSSSAGSSDTWAHPLSGPETGCLLIAHPLKFRRAQQYFHRAVILILNHNDRGSYGRLQPFYSLLVQARPWHDSHLFYYFNSCCHH